MQCFHCPFFSSSLKLKINASSSKEIKEPKLLPLQQRICTFWTLCPTLPLIFSTFPKISQQPTLTLLYSNTIRDVITMPGKEKQDNGISDEESIIKTES